MSRGLLVATLALLALFFAMSAALYPSLPDSIPARFSAVAVVGWTPKTPFSWFGLPLIALGLSALSYGVAAFIERAPGLINLPEKKRLLALPPERRKPVLRWVWLLLQVIALVEVVITALAQLATWRGAVARQNLATPLIAVVISLAAAVTLLALVVVATMVGEIGRQERAGP